MDASLWILNRRLKTPIHLVDTDAPLFLRRYSLALGCEESRKLATREIYI